MRTLASEVSQETSPLLLKQLLLLLGLVLASSKKWKQSHGLPPTPSQPFCAWQAFPCFGVFDTPPQ